MQCIVPVRNLQFQNPHRLEAGRALDIDEGASLLDNETKDAAVANAQYK